jgi:hypothetical protein
LETRGTTDDGDYEAAYVNAPVDLDADLAPIVYSRDADANADAFAVDTPETPAIYAVLRVESEDDYKSPCHSVVVQLLTTDRQAALNRVHRSLCEVFNEMIENYERDDTPMPVLGEGVNATLEQCMKLHCDCLKMACEPEYNCYAGVDIELHVQREGEKPQRIDLYKKYDAECDAECDSECDE